jgi:hypothetical protein
MKKLSYCAAAVASALVIGCGGGGSSDSGSITPAPVAKAEGAYEGTMSSGYAFNALVLENDEFWALYGQQSGGTLYVYGLLQGNGSSNGTHFAGPVRDFFYNGAVVAGNLAATYVPRTTLNGSATEGTQTVTFSGSAISTANFNYDQPASLAAVAGSWTGGTLNGSVGTVNISSTGVIAGSTSGCTFTGNLSPRASGKNVFNATITMGPAPCTAPGVTGTGIALNYRTNSGKSQLLVAGIDSTKSVGTAFLAQR